MAIVTYQTAPAKDASTTVSLNKTELSQLSVVAADLIFSDTANWRKVEISYGSSVGNQRKILTFDAEQASPTAQLVISDKARDEFEVKKITIIDFDSGYIVVSRADIPTASADFDFSLL